MKREVHCIAVNLIKYADLRRLCNKLRKSAATTAPQINDLIG